MVRIHADREIMVAHVFSHKRTELRRLKRATTRLCCAEAPGSEICGASEQFGIAQLPSSSKSRTADLN